MWDRLDALEHRYDDLTREMASPELTNDYERLQTLNKERSSLEDVVAMHPDLLQPVAIEKANPHRYGYGSGRFSTYSPFHLVRVPEPNPKPE